MGCEHHEEHGAIRRNPVGFRAAAELPLDALAALYTRCFAGYAYPVRVEPHALARRIRAEQIDLGRSPVLWVGDEPAGVALLGVRGAETNCGGLGITAPHRGRGLAHRLVDEHLRLARAAGGQRMTLMVLAENGGAVRAYLRAGMRVTRNLLWLEWRAGQPSQGRGGPALVAAAPAALLDRAGTLPHAAPFWQRDPATLRALEGLQGYELPGATGPDAYAIVEPAAAEPAQILEPVARPAQVLDLGARTPEAAARLIAGLQARHAALAINEPEESPAMTPLREAGFAAALTRYEMEVAL